MPIALHDGPRQMCAWPNLTLLPNGDIAALIFNQPCHGMWEGDIDCWASRDGGVSWEKRATATAHAPGTNRMNVGAGLDPDGHLLLLASGWTARKGVGQSTPHAEGQTLRAEVRRSRDGGRTWEMIGLLPEAQAPDWSYIPFGDVARAADGDLLATCYTRQGRIGTNHDYRTLVCRSADKGATWSAPTLLNPQGNETDLLHLGDGRWLACSREESNRQLWLLRSDDDGRSWVRDQPLSLPGQVTGHLARLADGRILCSYGNRCRNMTGVDVRFSADAGQTWGAPIRLVDTPMGDCGYPSTVQRADGRLVTALYAQQPGEYQYRMPVAIWDADDHTR